MPPNSITNISSNTISNNNSKPTPKAGAGAGAVVYFVADGVAEDVGGAVGRHGDLLGVRYLAEPLTDIKWSD